MKKPLSAPVSRATGKKDPHESKGDPVQLTLWDSGSSLSGKRHPVETSSGTSARRTANSSSRQLVVQKIEPAGAGVNDARIVVTDNGEKFIFKPFHTQPVDASQRPERVTARSKGPSPLQEARDLFHSAGLGFPPVPAELAPDFRKYGDWCFASGPVRIWPYELRSYVKRFRRRSVYDYVLLAHAGHGVNSYAISYYLVHKPLFLFVQVAWGGVYSDAARDAATVNRCFSLCADLVRAANDAVESKRWHRRDRMLIVASSFYGNKLIFPDRFEPIEKLDLVDPEEVLSEAIEKVRMLDARKPNV